MTAPGKDILIVGAGIIGVSAAALLAEAGHTVTVIDRKGIAEEASKGNAAALAFSDILPLASPGIMRKAPKWLLDPLGPLSIRPSYLPRLAPWLVRFWRACSPSRVEASIAAQSALMDLAAHEAEALFERARISHMVRHDGSLELYESEAEFRASLPGWQRRQNHGISFDHVRGARLADLQPGLSARFVAGTFVPGWKTVSDPFLLAKAVWAYAENHGARFERAEVLRLERVSGKACLIMADGSQRSAERIIVAGGAWSARLLSAITPLPIPLETERGYTTTLPLGAVDLRRQIIFGGHGFVMTPLSTGIRVGGAVELAGLKLAPNFARSKAMLAKAKDFLPDLRTEGGTEWMGFRPSMPDSLPVMGLLPGHGDIVLAFGNGHLGLTQSAAMARLVTDLVEGRPPVIDLAPYRLDRF